MTDAFRVRAVAMRDECVAFEVHAAALPRIADEASGTDRFRDGRGDTVCIRLRPVKFQRDRDVDGQIEFIVH